MTLLTFGRYETHGTARRVADLSSHATRLDHVVRKQTIGRQCWTMQPRSDHRPRQNVEEPEFRADGRAESRRHATQYRIDTRRQLSDINDRILSDDCIPFRHCPRSRRCTAVVWLWSLIRSETFLYLLHISSVAFGAANIGLFYYCFSSPLQSSTHLCRICSEFWH